MTSSSSSSSSSSPRAAAAAEPSAQDERAGRVSPLRVALWAAIAVVLATGVILYFRHQDEVAPVLGAAGSSRGTEAGHR